MPGHRALGIMSHAVFAALLWGGLCATAGAVDYKVLHVFGGGVAGDGEYPFSGLVQVGEALYGTTDLGRGSTTGCYPGNPVYVDGCGTVFSITPAGQEAVVYAFLDAPDGKQPLGKLLPVGGQLYGTTYNGGRLHTTKKGLTYEYGTVFALTPGGTESVVYEFNKTPDGSNPRTDLIKVGNTLYGTTTVGGLAGYGTVFALAPDGSETVLHSFLGGRDGNGPGSALINVNGVLYGTTGAGGNGHCPSGCGTVFSITPAGVETVLVEFQGLRKGSMPGYGLLQVGNQLYGTVGGGAYGDGAVFSMTLDGRLTGLYSFDLLNGRDPNGPLVNVGGVLYGTTYEGGSGTQCVTSGAGCGTVFSMSLKGAFTVLHSFSGRDGSNPAAGLVDVGGVLYGTTAYGGNTGCEFGEGCGTVFAIKP